LAGGNRARAAQQVHSSLELALGRKNLPKITIWRQNAQILPKIGP
jgi:hypothetical protein